MPSVNISSKEFESDEPIRVQSTKSRNGDSSGDSVLTVVNIRLEEDTPSEKTFVFDMLEGEDVDDARYVSRSYRLYPKPYGIGMFDLLDDYFLRRIKFFHSSKSCQSMMMALVAAERKLKSKTGMNMYDYCSDVMKRTVCRAYDDDDVDNPPDEDHLSVGYGICGESAAFRSAKMVECDASVMKWVADEVVAGFKKNIDYAENKHFVGIMTSTVDDIQPSFAIDPFIGLPIAVYIPEFAHLLMEKVCHQFLSNEVLKEAGVESIRVDVFLLMPDAKLSDVKALATDDFDVIDYDGLEENDCILAKYETFDIVEENVDDAKFDSIIAYS